MSTRARLVDAAAEVFTERGYEGAGVQEIARRAGLTTGPIYGNFRGKAELLAAAISAHSGPGLDSLLQCAEARGVELFAELGRRLFEGEPSPASALLLEALVASRRDPEVAEKYRRGVEERIGALQLLIEDARNRGEISPEVPGETLAQFGMALAFGAVALATLGILPDGDDWSALITRLVAALS